MPRALTPFQMTKSWVQISITRSSIHCLNGRQRSCQGYVRALHDEAFVQRRLCSHHGSRQIPTRSNIHCLNGRHRSCHGVHQSSTRRSIGSKADVFTSREQISTRNSIGSMAGKGVARSTAELYTKQGLQRSGPIRSRELCGRCREP